MKAMLAVILALPACGFAGQAGQRTYSPPFVDASPANSPMKANAIKPIVVREQLLQDAVAVGGWDLDASLTNVSSKDILAYEVRVNVEAELGGGGIYVEKVDLFFNRGTFSPGSQRSLQFSMPLWHVSGYNPSAPRAKASATFSVSFVEFSDGSTYGSSKWGRSLPDARRLTTRYIRQLQEAYASGGEQALKTALSSLQARKGDPEATKGELWHLERTLNTGGVSASIAEMGDFLAAAEKHANIEMK
jgi:hypothetical protein